MIGLGRRHRAPYGPAEARLLLTRCCFGASPGDIRASVAMGLEKTVVALLSGDFRPRLAPEHLARLDEMIPKSFEELRARFLLRALTGGDALRMTMTLLLHDHLATAFRKVRHIPYMLEHLNLLTSHALGDFKALLLALADDPAMLIWLDGASSTRARPNENFARELMELFTLGHGHYSESDIKAAARVFTGRHVGAEGTRFLADDHDEDEKEAFGQAFRTEAEFIDILTREEACAPFLGRKIARQFLGDELARELSDDIAETLRRVDFDLGRFLAEVLQSEAMFSDAARMRRVRSPLEFVIGSLRALEAQGSGLELAAHAAGMGQSFADPPSVAGWPRGRDWISTATIILRQRFALEVEKGRKGTLRLRRMESEPGTRSELAFALLGLEIDDESRIPEDSVFSAAATLLQSPEAQLI